MEAQTNYAKSGDVHIAYRIFGDGPHDIVLVPGTISHVELYWEFPMNEYLLRRLTSFSRVIVFDKRGQGLSDRVAEQTLEERTGDVLAVMSVGAYGFTMTSNYNDRLRPPEAVVRGDRYAVVRLRQEEEDLTRAERPDAPYRSLGVESAR